ncbi:single-stranded-DNA-specific exonuclease RecJ [Helicobacter sp. MIT 21-1697]|uniref:single-stranded-DNA-specific exonuclease RecJ n=1 Tax=Helicobacter sp. MIT 21-1697 TaxID=2993733 RepID=UPI00224B6245|nr:single-stranded-DNA-specific exonuclease RecJ [Helicobacter sp. MIT 21-1697]MCX2717866.1 single-stranded-DNA-specific exonuclease RecJ [Helicobacter sp. MIT 21-1697]
MRHIDKDTLLQILLERDLEQGIANLRDLPKPDSLTHALKGAQKVVECMNKGQEILVVGDYDADGICASAVMCRFFESLGYENFRLVIPHRFVDGYGVSAALLEKYAHNASVVVSVDNGINAFCAGEWCKERDIIFIITDHHTPTDTLPQADVIIDPYLPDCNFIQKSICGAVVAWYFCAAIKQILGACVDMSIFLEYLALASIADVMPLVGINRILVKKGIESLCKSSSPLALLIRSKLKAISAQNLAFSIVPLLNCAGRMANAHLALNFLLAQSLADALRIYDELLELNIQRKSVQNEILSLAQMTQIESEHIVVSYGEDWHEGVLGIVASSLAEQKGKSAFVFSHNNGVLKGSGRSFGGANLIASITPLSAYLLRFGGHSGAVGISLQLEQLEGFIQTLESTLVFDEIGENAILGVIESANINDELLAICERFEPFGEGNPKPVFLCENLCIQSLKPLGKDKKHLSYILSDKSNGVLLEAIEFFAPQMREIGQIGNVQFELMRDDYKNKVKLKIVQFP